MSRRVKRDPSVVAAYSRASRVGGRAGDGFISFDDQEDGIGRCARELGLTIPDDGWFRERFCQPIRPSAGLQKDENAK